MDSTKVYPKQKLLRREKEAEDGAFFKNTINYYIQQCDSYGNEKYEMMSLYNLLGDEIDPLDYKHVLNPFNFKQEEYKRMPAKLRNYNIIKPIIDLFLGEQIERIDSFQVITTSNEENDYQKGLTTEITKALAQKVVNVLNNAGYNTGVDSQDVPEIQEIETKYKREYGKIQSTFGQEALDYIIYDQDLDDKGQVTILDYLITGRTYTLKEVHHNDVHFSNLSPLFAYHPRLDPYQNIEDGQWFAYRHRKTPNEIIDRFRSRLTDDQVTMLDDVQSDGEFLTNPTTIWMNTETFSTDEVGNKTARRYYDSGKLDMWQVFWRGFKAVQILTYQDQLGRVQEMEVTEDYILIPEIGDISLETEWISCVYTGFKVELIDREGFFIEWGELPVDRSELNNSSVSKLPVNGIVDSTRSGQILSFAKASLPYQMSTNIIFFQAEKFINKMKAKLTVLPLSLFPNDHPEWSEEKFMWASEALDLLVVDDTKRNAMASLNAIKSLSVGTERQVIELFDIARNLKMDYWESFGMNRQRYGDINQSAGKGVTEQANIRSAVITAELYRRINKLREKDLEGLLDYSKLAWIDGKKGNYVNSEGRIMHLSLNRDNIINHVNRDYRIFVKNNSEEQSKLDFVKQQMLFGASQNGMNPKVQFAMLNANNAAQAEQRVDEAMAVIEKGNQAAAKVEQEAAQAALAMEQAKLEVDKYKADKDYDAAIDSKMIDAQMKSPGDAAKIRLDWENLRKDWGKLELEKQTQKDRVTIENKKIKSNEKIAAANNKAKSSTSNNSK